MPLSPSHPKSRKERQSAQRRKAMHLNPGYRVKGVGTGSGGEGRSVNLSPPGQKTGEGPRRCWNEGILAREKKNHIGGEEAGTLKGRKADRLL